MSIFLPPYGTAYHSQRALSRKIFYRKIGHSEKISLDALIPLIIKILRRHGGRGRKEEVEKELYARFKCLFSLPWYQETVSTGVQRWQYVITLAKEVAKSKGLIKRPEHSNYGYWELSEKGKE